jgi:hypothetical protein
MKPAEVLNLGEVVRERARLASTKALEVETLRSMGLIADADLAYIASSLAAARNLMLAAADGIHRLLKLDQLGVKSGQLYYFD